MVRLLFDPVVVLRGELRSLLSYILPSLVYRVDQYSFSSPPEIEYLVAGLQPPTQKIEMMHGQMEYNEDFMMILLSHRMFFSILFYVCS